MRSSFGNGKLVVTVPKTKPAIEDKKATTGGQQTAHGGSSGGRVRTIPIQSKSTFDTRDSAAYKTKEVNIDSDSEDSSWPDSNLFRSRFDNWKMGTTFGDWIRPIQLFDEDFFMDSFQR